MKEIVKMGEMPVELEQVLEETGWLARWEARGRTEGALAIAQNMVNLGLPLETVVSATQLKPEQVRIMYQHS
jgi:predicted transposase YdaD